MLHLVDGKDYFISVTGHLVPTAFGCTIKELVRMVEPVRQHNLLVDVEGKVRLVEQHRAVQRMSNYWQGTGGLRISADNQLGVCKSKHIILSLKTDGRVWQGSGNRRR